MNAALYFVCLVLTIPIAGIAAFGLLIDSLTKFGLWEVFKALVSPIFDPFGKGIWIILLLLSLIGLIGAGLFEQSRPYGFGTIALAGVVCTLFVLRVYPGPWEPGNIFLFLPGLAGIVLSVYCLVRPPR